MLRGTVVPKTYDEGYPIDSNSAPKRPVLLPYVCINNRLLLVQLPAAASSRPTWLQQ